MRGCGEEEGGGAGREGGGMLRPPHMSCKGGGGWAAASPSSCSSASCEVGVHAREEAGGQGVIPPSYDSVTTLVTFYVTVFVTCYFVFDYMHYDTTYVVDIYFSLFVMFMDFYMFP